jgi:hypothetical protein
MKLFFIIYFSFAFNYSYYQTITLFSIQLQGLPNERMQGLVMNSIKPIILCIVGLKMFIVVYHSIFYLDGVLWVREWCLEVPLKDQFETGKKRKPILSSKKGSHVLYFYNYLHIYFSSLWDKLIKRSSFSLNPFFLVQGFGNAGSWETKIILEKCGKVLNLVTSSFFLLLCTCIFPKYVYLP